MKYTAFIFIMLPMIVLSQVQEHSLIVPQRFSSFYESEYILSYPSDFKTSVFYVDTNLKRPRFMAINSKNVLHIADMDADKIFAIPDADNDGIGDTLYVASPNVDSVHSLAFWKDTMYVAEPTRIRKFIDIDNNGYYETEFAFITGIGAEGPYNHYTRTIIIDSLKKKLYVSVGASCNACRESDPERGAILEFNMDGTGRKIYATGLRNAIGLVVDNETELLWAANADRDNLGDDIPLEIVTPVSDGDFFGWPFAYGNGTWVDFTASDEYKAILPLTAYDSVRVAGMVSAPISFDAHTTPMGIIFYDDPRIYIQAPPKTLLIARHGSSKGGRPIGHGYDILRYQWNPLIAMWEGGEFLKGFLTDSTNYTYWGRPCGLVQDSASNIYLSSDKGITAIYRIALADNNQTTDMNNKSGTYHIYPNPSSGIFTLSLPDEISTIREITIYDVLGRTYDINIAQSTTTDLIRCNILDSDITHGIYFINIMNENSQTTLPILLVK